MTAVTAALCAVTGLVVGGYGVDLLRLRRPDFEVVTMLAAAVVAGLAWVAGAVVTWSSARRRPRPTRVDVTLLVVAAVFAMWLCTAMANTIRGSNGNFGPMIDPPVRDRDLLSTAATAYNVDGVLAVLTLAGLALTRVLISEQDA